MKLRKLSCSKDQHAFVAEQVGTTESSVSQPAATLGRRNLPQPVIDPAIPAPAPGEAPHHRTGELFDFQTTRAPAGSGELFAEQPVARMRRKGRKT
ncbi:MAG TPA: hypothetical protein VN829_05900 [Dongiaceae bacterium]|nr:hypothetical protein [Dongiaceae bacterium]